MKKLIFLFGILSLSLSLIVSCSNNVFDEMNKEAGNNVPYASVEELDALAKSDANVVNYQVARTLGLIEMQNFLESCSWSNTATLTETPVVIYSENDTPEYYEFHVIDGNEIAGYVTCTADKRLGDPIQYISRDRKIYNISNVTAKSSNQSKIKIYNNGYPNVVVSSDMVIKTKSSTENNYKTEEEMLEEWANSFTDEELAEIGATRDDIKKEYYNGQKEEQERLETLWDLISKAESDILSTTDDMIIQQSNITAKSPIYYGTDVYVLEDWNNPMDKYIRLNGACGPTSLLQAMRGFFTKYGYSTFGVKDYSEMLDRCWSIWDIEKTTVTTYHGLRNGLEKMTNNKLTLTHGWYCFWGGVSFNHIKNELMENQLPILSLRGFRTFWIWEWFKDQWHYRNIIGTAERKYKEDKHFLWWNWTAYWTDKYYLMVDNGFDANNSTKAGVITNSSFDPIMNKYDDDYTHCKFWESSRSGQLAHYPYKFK